MSARPATRIGLTLPLNGGVEIADTVLPLARLAEGCGYTDIWSSEVAGTDGFTPLAAIAAVTEQVRLGTAIVPVCTRPPALTAMSAAAVQAFSGGRFVLGLGTSTPAIVEGWMGIPFRSPLATMRETLELISDILNGTKTAYAGTAVRSSGFRLSSPCVAPVPIHIAALGPRMLKLAGCAADGAILFLVTLAGAAEASTRVRRAAEEADRDQDALEITVRVPVAVGGDEDARRRHMRRWLVGYVIADAYHRSLARQGFGRECATIVERWAAGDRAGAVAAVSDRMLEELCVVTDASACRNRLRALRQAGVSTPVLLPIPVGDDAAERLISVGQFVLTMAPGALIDF
jgi:probable F420-dependent oxidoreductase